MLIMAKIEIRLASPGEANSLKKIPFKNVFIEIIHNKVLEIKNPIISSEPILKSSKKY